jgi:hypothetical protein
MWSAPPVPCTSARSAGPARRTASPAVVVITPVHADGLHKTADYAERIASEVGTTLLATVR